MAGKVSGQFSLHLSRHGETSEGYSWSTKAQMKNEPGRSICSSTKGEFHTTSSRRSSCLQKRVWNTYIRACEDLGVKCLQVCIILETDVKGKPPPPTVFCNNNKSGIWYYYAMTFSQACFLFTVASGRGRENDNIIIPHHNMVCFVRCFYGCFIFLLPIDFCEFFE